MDMGEGSAMWTSIGESNWVRARESGPRDRFLGGVLDSTVIVGGDSMERLLRSVIEGKSVSALVLTDEYWTSSDGCKGMSLATIWDARRCFISTSTRFCSSSLKIPCSFCFSSSTCRSISRRALTSHSRRIIDSRAVLNFSFSLFTFEAFASASCALSIVCSSFVFSILPSSTTSLSFLISRTIGRFSRLTVSGRFSGLTFKQLLMTLCNSCEYIDGNGSIRPSLIF